MNVFSPNFPRLALLTTLFLGAGLQPLPAEDLHFDLLSTGAMKKTGGFMPQRLTLSAQKPREIKKVPMGLTAPLYGVLKLGPAEAPTVFGVVLDEPTGQPPRLWVDANGNGDFTDDPPAVWESKPYAAQDGKPTFEFMEYHGGATVQVAYGAEVLPLHLEMYRFDKKDPARAAFKNALFYYADYAREGNIILGDKPRKSLLVDRLATGDFRGKKEAMFMHGKPFSGVQLFIDLDGDGRYNFRSEVFDAWQPFEVDGATYQVTGLTASGDSFHLEKTGK